MKSPFGIVWIKRNGKQHSFVGTNTKKAALSDLAMYQNEFAVVVKGEFEATDGEYWLVYRMKDAAFWRALRFTKYHIAKSALDAFEEEAYHEMHMYKTLDS